MLEIVKVQNEQAVIEKLAKIIEESANTAIAENNVFRIGLSGGSLIKYMTSLAVTLKTDWTKWKLFFCDERYVEESDEDSTYGQYKKHFVPLLPKLELSQFLKIDGSLDLNDCAHAYEQEIYKLFDIQDVSKNKKTFLIPTKLKLKKKKQHNLSLFSSFFFCTPFP